jgi:peptidoglycan/LPS O-acetylase OafA/YrhL
MAEAARANPQNIELQSLRGIAAIVVMVHHGLRTLKPDGWAWAASEVLLNAHGAVVIFFVLSGYVLSGSLARRGLDKASVSGFYVRRAFRIYPALWVGIALGTAYVILIRPLPAPELSAWMMGHYKPELLRPTIVVGSVIGSNNFLLPPAWTITIELLASLLLPGLVWAFARHRGLALVIVLMLALISAVSGVALRQVPFYLVHFAFGVALACLPPLARLRPRGGAMLAALLLLLFTHVVLHWEQYAWWLSLIEGLAATVLIAGIVGSDRPWLRHRSLVALGDWSYSIYLIHVPVAFSVAQLMDHAGLVGASRNGWALLVAAVTTALTVPLAALVFHYVERPGISAGATLLRRWHRWRDSAIRLA